jgi:hypothetical protein
MSYRVSFRTHRFTISRGRVTKKQNKVRYGLLIKGVVNCKLTHFYWRPLLAKACLHGLCLQNQSHSGCGLSKKAMSHDTRYQTTILQTKTHLLTNFISPRAVVWFWQVLAIYLCFFCFFQGAESGSWQK